MSTAAALIVVQLVIGAGAGIAVRLGLLHLIAQEPDRIHVLLELITAALLGALSAAALLRATALLQFTGFGAMAGLVGYAVACGILAGSRRSRRPRRVAVAVSHGLASLAASSCGALAALAAVLAR